jgi:soluble lytic murein transglycosylase-like protein
MRRLLFLVVLLPGFHQSAWADSRERTDTIPAYLTQRFGVAKEKAIQISAAVTTAAEKYSLPPAILLAIISIESRFREKAHGAGGATGLMQVVPSAHRNLLRNVKDLTDPDVNIDVGSSILYGYMRHAGGDLNAAMKSYGGSTAYAQKIRARAEEFAPLFAAQPSGTSAASAALVAAGADGGASAVFVLPEAYAVSTGASSAAATGAVSEAVSGAVAVPIVRKRRDH